MKRTIVVETREILFTFLLTFLICVGASMPAHAATIHGLVSNMSQYPKAMVCVPDIRYATEFAKLLDGVNPDNTNRFSAVTLYNFFQDTTKSSCYLVRPDGNFSIDLPDSNVYLFLIVMTENGEHSYWHVWNVDAQIEQIVTTDAPSF